MRAIYNKNNILYLLIYKNDKSNIDYINLFIISIRYQLIFNNKSNIKIY